MSKRTDDSDDAHEADETDEVAEIDLTSGQAIVIKQKAAPKFILTNSPDPDGVIKTITDCILSTNIREVCFWLPDQAHGNATKQFKHLKSMLDANPTILMGQKSGAKITSRSLSSLLNYYFGNYDSVPDNTIYKDNLKYIIDSLKDLDGEEEKKNPIFVATNNKGSSKNGTTSKQ